MKRYIYWFIVFQLLDIITTYVGINIGLHEANRVWQENLLVGILIKLFMVYAISDTAQYLKEHAILWVLPILSAGIVAWNGLNILLVVLV